jgi:hypothetical protein
MALSQPAGKCGYAAALLELSVVGATRLARKNIRRGGAGALAVSRTSVADKRAGVAQAFSAQLRIAALRCAQG